MIVTEVVSTNGHRCNVEMIDKDLLESFDLFTTSEEHNRIVMRSSEIVNGMIKLSSNIRFKTTDGNKLSCSGSISILDHHSTFMSSESYSNSDFLLVEFSDSIRAAIIMCKLSVKTLKENTQELNSNILKDSLSGFYKNYLLTDSKIKGEIILKLKSMTEMVLFQLCKERCYGTSLKA